MSSGVVAGRLRPVARRVLVLDVGGSHVKVAFSDSPHEIKILTGPKMTPGRLMRRVVRAVRGQSFDAVAIGYPGLVIRGRIARDPAHLGPGWVGFNFERALDHPTRIVNDAMLQALGSYRGGRMLFLSLGTGLGSALILDGTLAPLELAHLPYKKGREIEEFVGEIGLERLGRKKWEKEVFTVVDLFERALEPDYVVLGGGNVYKLKRLPPHSELSDNHAVIVGGARLWDDTTRAPSEGQSGPSSVPPAR